MSFSEMEFNRFRAGETVALILASSTQHEIGLFSVGRINAPKKPFPRYYEKEEMNLETAAAKSWASQQYRLKYKPTAHARGTYLNQSILALAFIHWYTCMILCYF